MLEKLIYMYYSSDIKARITTQKDAFNWKNTFVKNEKSWKHFECTGIGKILLKFRV